LDRFCANEVDYHQRVIRHLATFPDLLKARPGLETFVEAMKLTCMTLAAGGGNGCADLLPQLLAGPMVVELASDRYSYALREDPSFS